jgi:hypothetical protein
MALSHCLRLCCGLMAVGLLVGLAGHAKAQPTYSFTTLDVPGASNTYPQGINNSGQIVGSYSDGAGQHGFLATPCPNCPPSCCSPSARSA